MEVLEILFALSLDAFHSNHAVNFARLNQSESDVIMAQTVYNKGSSILKMIEHLMGTENFRKALNYYLMKHQYSNAKIDDLLKAFDLFSYKPVRKIMNAWLKRRGYPMLKVRQNGNCYSLKQEKFSIDGVNNEEEKKMLWKIPMIYKSKMN
ncbi:puromycin-sensitive aminopeptidase-like isoform X2, partial [Leptotrombidium deliense]